MESVRRSTDAFTRALPRMKSSVVSPDGLDTTASQSDTNRCEEFDRAETLELIELAVNEGASNVRDWGES